ncbi:hypothetical protein OG738_17475 [Amycolatopsis sp. NBC_01488]|uniref:hypothetical protein n=1 Tax=Amycolatopsis sp. NBC_01488 TaxID=2903563 RepID=UPI002E2E279B|nr:hypothetical protein [Amycolatopsis sp. NBC_01488]
MTMAGELWTSIASMIGVVVGGGLTFATQRTTQRAVERVEERKQRAALQEARRTEQIRALLEFIRFAHEAEGVAHARPPSWDVGDDWYRTARPAMDGLRVAEKSVELLCTASLRAPTARYGRALNQAVWQERADMPIGEQLEPFRSAFLSAARLSLGTTGPGESAN